MADAIRYSPVAWSRALPNEHGFWVMLSASLLSALLRTNFGAVALATSAGVFGAAVLLAGLSHRRIRGREPAQLGATACLALAGAPVEWVSRLPLAGVLAGTLARLAIFLASALFVRAAFARSARDPAIASSTLQQGAVALVAATGALLGLAERFAEARACLMAAAVYLVLARGKPTAKQLRPLGLTLAGLALCSAVALAL